MRSEQVTEIAAALAKAQGAIANATLNRINPHFKSRYADLAAVRDAVRGPLSDNGLALTQTTEIRDGALILVTTLHHSSGQWIASEYPLPAAGRPQEMGSALTYARRYTMSAMLGIAADEDDDANAAESAHKKNGNGQAVGSLDAKQVEWLRACIVEVGADIPKFLGYISKVAKRPVERIEDIPAAVYQDAVNALNAKRKEAAQ
jgi:hypothetical protein